MKPPWFRRLAIAAAAALLLLAIAAGVLIATFDADRFKSIAVDWMKTEHQRTLAIDGAIRLSVFPRIAVQVAGLRLSERGGDAGFVSIDEARLALRLLPLLSRRIVIDRVGARGVAVAYRRGADGVRNIDDFLTGSAGQPGATADSGGSMSWAVSSITLADLRLAVRDEITGIAGDVTVQSLTSTGIAEGAASTVEIKATARLTQPQAATLAVDGRMSVTPDLARHAVALSAVDVAVTGAAAGVSDVAMRITGELGWGGSAMSASALRVAIDRATIAGWTLAPSTVAVRRAAFDATKRRLELDAVQVDAKARVGADVVDLAFDWPQLDVSGDRISGSGVSGRLKVSGATSIDATLKSAAPGGGFDRLTLPGLALTLKGSAGARRIDASAGATLVLDRDTRRAELGQLTLRATIDDPGLQPLQLAAQGSIGADAGAARWQLQGGINGNRFETRGNADLTRPVPSVQASARFASLDLNRLLRPAPPAAGGATAGAEASLPLDALNAVDGRFELDAGSLAWRSIRVGDARFAATIDSGRLRLTRLAGRIWGGSVEASGSADAGDRRVAVKADADRVDVDAMLKDIAGKDLLAGRGRVVADLRSGGATVGAWRSQLAGTVSLKLRDGAIKGYNLARSLRQAQAALSLQQDSLVRSSADERTDFSELSASARIDGGVARSDDLDLRTPFLRVGGDGSVDVGRGRIDYTARATVVATSAGQGGAGIDALRGLTVPVRLTGPLDAVDWRIRWSEVAAGAVRQRLQDKLGAALGGQLKMPGGAASAPGRPEDVVKNRLKDRLKGLFR